MAVRERREGWQGGWPVGGCGTGDWGGWLWLRIEDAKDGDQGFGLREMKVCRVKNDDGQDQEAN